MSVEFYSWQPNGFCGYAEIPYSAPGCSLRRAEEGSEPLSSFGYRQTASTASAGGFSPGVGAGMFLSQKCQVAGSTPQVQFLAA